MPDEPFADLGLDRTVIMPQPGGRAVPKRPGPGEPTDTPDAAAVTSGLNPLVAAANSLLNVIPQLRASVEHADAAALRDGLAQRIRQFEVRAKAAGLPTEKVIAARYSLCTVIDEAATSTPWGASGAWAQHGLLVLFHNETEGGEKFFQLLARLAENPEANLDLLELMYVCLQLGFEGRYRIAQGGQRDLETIRQRLLLIIRKQHGEYERDLSPNWRRGGRPAAARLAATLGDRGRRGAVPGRHLSRLYAQAEQRLGQGRRGDCGPPRGCPPAPEGGARASAGAVPRRRNPAGARRGR